MLSEGLSGREAPLTVLRLTSHSLQRGRTLERLWAISLLHTLSRGETPHFPSKIGKSNMYFVSVRLGGSPTCGKDT